MKLLREKFFTDEDIHAFIELAEGLHLEDRIEFYRITNARLSPGELQPEDKMIFHNLVKKVIAAYLNDSRT